MMKKFKLGKDILILTIITFITVLTWVGFEVWLAATKTTITKVTQEQMSPLNPQINKQIVESLKDNLSLSQEEMNQSISSPSATESSQNSTESASLE